MDTLRIRYTRHDGMTRPGGIILRKRDNGDGTFEYIAHNFTRDMGEKTPKEFFWGSYSDNLEDGEKEFNRKVRTAAGYDRGGSLIPEENVNSELTREKIAVERKNSTEVHDDRCSYWKGYDCNCTTESN